MVEKVDADKDGQITHQEFYTIMQPIILEAFMKPETDLDEIRSLFK